MASNDELKALFMQRARLIGAAANKLDALRQVMRARLHTTHTLFYCGDGGTESSMSRRSSRQITTVARILGGELGYRVNTYTAQTPLAEREKLRQQFESGELQGLIAIRCLDEGVDIPAIRNAIILASSSNPRQFIQRRGRVLRPHPGKERATLFDMIVRQPSVSAVPEVRKIIERVLELEKDKLYMKVPKYINDDILQIVKEEVQ